MKSILLAFVFLVLGGLAFFYFQKSGIRLKIQNAAPNQGKFEDAMLHWMSLNIADKEAELLIVTEPPVSFNGLFHRMVKIRARNGFGAPVINDLIVMGTAQNHVQKVYPIDDFLTKTLEMEGSMLEGYKEVIKELDKIFSEKTKAK
jgi:hypothetical protein